MALPGLTRTAQAQLPALNLSARVGLGVPSENYNRSCGDASFAYSVDVQGRGRVFPHLSVDHFSGSGGGSDLCIAGGTARGGFNPDGATRVGIGAGARVGGRLLQLEGLVSTGFVTGRYGFPAPGASEDKTTVPHVGGQVALVLFRTVVFSAGANWLRLPLDITPVGGGAVTKRPYWSPMVTLQTGLRVGLGR